MKTDENGEATLNAEMIQVDGDGWEVMDTQIQEETALDLQESASTYIKLGENLDGIINSVQFIVHDGSKSIDQSVANGKMH